MQPQLIDGPVRQALGAADGSLIRQRQTRSTERPRILEAGLGLGCSWIIEESGS